MITDDTLRQMSREERAVLSRRSSQLTTSFQC
jgi:hypothetical protein